jgi:hypothetical protein
MAKKVQVLKGMKLFKVLFAFLVVMGLTRDLHAGVVVKSCYSVSEGISRSIYQSRLARAKGEATLEAKYKGKHKTDNKIFESYFVAGFAKGDRFHILYTVDVDTCHPVSVTILD